MWEEKMENNDSLQEHRPKHLSTVRITQSPNRQNYSKEEFSTLLGNYCSLASKNNTPFLIEVNFLKTDDLEPTSQNLVYRLNLPIFPERYNYERFLSDYFSYMYHEQMGCSMSLSNETPLLPNFALYIESNVRNLPYNIKEYFEHGSNKDFERFKTSPDSFMSLIQQSYPKHAEMVNNYISASMKGYQDLEQVNQYMLEVAQNKTPVLPFDKDPDQAKRLVNYISYKLAQTVMWAYEDMEEERAKVLLSFKLHDDDFILDYGANGRVASAVCEIAVPFLKKFENTLSQSKKPPQPGDNN